MPALVSHLGLDGLPVVHSLTREARRYTRSTILAGSRRGADQHPHRSTFFQKNLTLSPAYNRLAMLGGLSR
jgi:hypothetical protein